MTVAELLETAQPLQFVIDAEGNKTAVQIDFTVWQNLLGLLTIPETELEIPYLTRTAARLMAEKGVTLTDLLENLDEVKLELYEEKYAANPISNRAPIIS